VHPTLLLPQIFFLDFFASSNIIASMKYCKKCKTPIEKPSYCAPCKAAYEKAWRAEHPGYNTEAKKRWINVNRDRSRARDNYRYALKTGKLVRGCCAVCGTTEKVEGHHTDYNKPLEVIWLCRPHHIEAHNKLRFDNQ